MDDTTPAWPKPDAHEIEAAQRAIVAAWENSPPDTVSLASNVARVLQRQGHSLRVAAWAIHGMIESGRLAAALRKDLTRPADWQNLSDFQVWPGDRFFEEFSRADAPPGQEGEPGGNSGKPKTTPDDSAWVPATTLWRDRFKTNRELTKFRKAHPEMFRNPSARRLEIHASKWLAYWAKRDKAGFEGLDDEHPSIADDPHVSEEFVAESAKRLAEIRAKKQVRK